MIPNPCEESEARLPPNNNEPNLDLQICVVGFLFQSKSAKKDLLSPGVIWILPPKLRNQIL